MTMLKFKKTADVPSEAGLSAGVAVVGDHRIAREIEWTRTNGGWHYAFACSCGWRGKGGTALTSKNNSAAERHASEVTS